MLRKHIKLTCQNILVKGVLIKLKNRKIKSINMVYPDTKDMRENLYQSYNKTLAKVLVDILPVEYIDILISELEYKETQEKTISS